MIFWVFLLDNVLLLMLVGLGVELGVGSGVDELVICSYFCCIDVVDYCILF